jgi:PAS domain S-box-containing protein
VTGWSAEEIANANVMELVYPDANYRAEISAWVSSLQAGYKDLRMVGKDGQVIESSWANVRLPDGRHVAIGLDIRERKRAEEALRQTLKRAEQGERMLEALMEYVPEGITMADADLNLVRVSRYGQELLGGAHAGRSAEDVATQWAVYHADGITPMAPEELPLVQAVQRGEVVRNMELVQLNARGEPLPLLCTAGPIRDAEGTIIGAVVAWRDIAERKQAEEALRESEALYRAIARHFPDGAIYIFDHDLRFRVADGQAMNVLGYRREDLEGTTVSDIADPETRHYLEARYPRVLAGESLHFETSLKGRVFSSDYVPIRDDNGAIVAGMVVSHDVTERTRTEEQLRNYASELEQLNEANRLLLREINHRVKNNLTAILGLIFAEQNRLRRESGDAGTIACYLAALNDLSERIRSLATAHTLLSEGGWRPLSVGELAERVVHASAPAAAAADGVQPQVEICGEEVYITPEQAHHLALVLGELTTNAIKYGRQANGLHITVEVEWDDGDVRLIYHNQGPPYPDGVLAGEQRSVGLGLVDTIVRHSLRGSWSIWNSEGPVTEIRFPGGSELRRAARGTELQ